MTIPTLLGTGGHAGGTTFSGTYFSNVGLGRCAMIGDAFTTESWVGQTIRVAGSISYLSWQLSSAFGCGASITLALRLRQNGSNSALAVYFYPSTTGWVTDSTHSVSILSGDVLDFAADVLPTSVNYSQSFYCTSARFDATTDSAQMLVTVGSSASTISPTNSQKFVNFQGVLGAGDGTEGNTQFKSLAAGTWQNMACYVDSNGFSEDTTFNNRIGGSNGSMAFSVPTTITGGFEDTLDSDSVSVGDYLDYGFVGTTSVGTGALGLAWIGAHFLASDTALCMIGGAASAPLTLEGTNYSSLFGGGDINTLSPNLPRATGLFPYALTASEFTNFITSATSNGSVTFTLLKNGSGTVQTITTSENQSGHITDNSAEGVTYDVGDTCANELVLVSGQVVWASASVLLTTS